MSSSTDYLENKLIDFLLRGQSFVPPASLYAALFTTSPSDSGGGTEVSGSGYARVTIASGLTAWAGTQGAGTTSASSGTSSQTSNNAAITFGSPAAPWGTVVAAGLFDAPTGGNLWFYSPLTNSKTIAAGDPAPSFAPGAVTYGLDYVVTGGFLTTFDHLYPSGLTLTSIDNAAITSIARPASRASGVSDAHVQWVDAAYGTKCFKITDIDTDGAVSPAPQVRHEYSRRFPMNCDNTLYIAYETGGRWRLYHGPAATLGTPFTPINASGGGPAGTLNGLAGLDVEPDWSKDDPLKLGYWGGGLTHYWKTFSNLAATTVTETNTVRVNFTGRLPWASAEQVWTKSEGMSDAAQRYYCFMATRYNSGTSSNEIFGLFTWDAQTDTILGTMASSTWGGISAFPDHCSMAASGLWAVPSWAFSPSLGTRALPRDLSSFGIMLRNDSQHSDCAFGPSGEDFLVYADYVSSSPDEGYVVMVNMATNVVKRLFGLYFNGGSTGMHISAKCFNRPGWVVVSTYADGSSGNVTPANPQQAIYRKIFLCELRPGANPPLLLNVAHTQANANYGGYFGEHQAVCDRDLTHIVSATNFNDATSTGGDPKVEDMLVALHSTSVPTARAS